jgi:hypothetical protein
MTFAPSRSCSATAAYTRRCSIPMCSTGVAPA